MQRRSKEKMLKLAKATIPKPCRLLLKRMKRIFYKVYYVGSRLECPFCRGHFRKFLPYYAEEGSLQVVKEKQIVDAGNMLDFYCPYCHSSSRERLMYLYLMNETNIYDDNINLLHIAPENNLQIVLKGCRNIEYISGDIDLEKSPAMVKIDITNIEYNNNVFDVIICSHVLEHIPDDRQAISELSRVLKPGGWAMLLVPIALLLDKTYEDPEVTSEEDRIRFFGQSDHLRIYGRDFKKRLEHAGLQVTEFKWSNSSERYGGPGNKFGLLEDEVVYIAHKGNN